MLILKVALCLSPVFLLLIMLLVLDSLRLVNKTILSVCLLWGICSAVMGFFINTWLIRELGLSFEFYSNYLAPVVEELLKIILVVILIRKNRIGFMIDAAVYAFSTGAAFSLAENLFYLFMYGSAESNLMVWITRGFGTAVMHGGTSAVFAIILISSLNREAGFFLTLIYGAIASVLIHAMFNNFIIYPVIATVFIVTVVPVSLILSFQLNENAIRKWLEMEFDSEVRMMQMIRKGKFSETKTGSFLLSLRQHFPSDVVFDMYCFISLYLELSIKAKSLMMLKENNFLIPPDPHLAENLKELRNLKKAIGRSGYLAISPVLRMNRKDLWKLAMLAAEKQKSEK